MIFDDIAGQETAIERLKNYVECKTADGAYLFTGPDGVGKAIAAVSFAKAANCLTPGSYGCNDCVSCRKIDKGIHPDVHIIDSAHASDPAKDADADSNQIKIAAIRALQEDINYRPYEARKKVFIINDAHQMNLESSSAFLKTLEEPPADSLIILVTSRPSMLLATIRSRCRVVKFFPMSRNTLEEVLLKKTADGCGIDAGQAHFLAYFAEGSLGRALKLRAQCMYEKKNEVIDLFCSPGAGAGLSAFDSRQDLLTSFNILASWFRDIYLLKTGAGRGQLIHSDRENALDMCAGSYSFEDLDRIFATLSESVLNVGRQLNKKLLVSNVMVSCKHGPRA
ncbi:MAG: DNA polymerase III subunit [Candidatus Omnitrophica bacterium]|nr:DNA polymerase III subunit [Candidatus Omnitrophota bacterium]